MVDFGSRAWRRGGLERAWAAGCVGSRRFDARRLQLCTGKPSLAGSKPKRRRTARVGRRSQQTKLTKGGMSRRVGRTCRGEDVAGRTAARVKQACYLLGVQYSACRFETTVAARTLKNINCENTGQQASPRQTLRSWRRLLAPVLGGDARAFHQVQLVWSRALFGYRGNEAAQVMAVGENTRIPDHRNARRRNQSDELCDELLGTHPHGPVTPGQVKTNAPVGAPPDGIGGKRRTKQISRQTLKLFLVTAVDSGARMKVHAKRMHVQIRDDAWCAYSGGARRQPQGDARGNAWVDIVRIAIVGDLGKVCVDPTEDVDEVLVANLRKPPEHGRLGGGRTRRTRWCRTRRRTAPAAREERQPRGS